jgi:hypothetical protein
MFVIRLLSYHSEAEEIMLSHHVAKIPRDTMYKQSNCCYRLVELSNNVTLLWPFRVSGGES